MINVDYSDLIYLHDQILKESGGLVGIRDSGALHSALARPDQTAFEKETYVSIFEKTAALLDSIANNHGFIDGNKRTAMAAASLFLYLNGYNIVFTDTEYEEFMIFVVTAKPSIRTITRWIESHSEKSR